MQGFAINHLMSTLLGDECESKSGLEKNEHGGVGGGGWAYLNGRTIESSVKMEF